MFVTYNQTNLCRHKVKAEEIDEVLASDPLAFDLGPSRAGNDRVMFVGFTYAGRLLEIGIEYFSSSREHVFHAMRATKLYREAFEKGTKK